MSWSDYQAEEALRVLRNVDGWVGEIHDRLAGILQRVVDPVSMATAPQADILRDVKPGQLVRLLLVGGGELAGDYQGYTDEMDHTYAWVAAREGRATVRVAHVAGVVELNGR